MAHDDLLRETMHNAVRADLLEFAKWAFERDTPLDVEQMVDDYLKERK